MGAWFCVTKLNSQCDYTVNKRNSQGFSVNLFTFGIVNKLNGVKIVFYNNYVTQCNKKGMSPSAAAEAMGFKRSMVTRWKAGSQPRQATLQRMADFFGCSVYDLTTETKKAPANEGEGWEANVTKRQAEVIRMVSQLSDQEADLLISQIRGILQDR